MSNALLQLALNSEDPIFVCQLPGMGLRSSLMHAAENQKVGHALMDLDSYGDINTHDGRHTHIGAFSKFVWNFKKDLKTSSMNPDEKSIIILDSFEFIPKEQQVDFFAFVMESLKDTHTTVILPISNSVNVVPEVRAQAVLYVPPQVRLTLKNSMEEVTDIVKNMAQHRTQQFELNLDGGDLIPRSGEKFEPFKGILTEELNQEVSKKMKP